MEAAKNPSTKDEIMESANLTPDQVRELLDLVLDWELVKVRRESRPKFKITEKGEGYLATYQGVKRAVDSLEM